MLDYDLIFSFVNASVLPAWAMLIFAPRWIWTERLVHSALWPLGLGAVYFVGIILVVAFGEGTEGAGFLSIDQVARIFGSDAGVVTGWAHYLVFDLFVGAWCARDAKRRGVAHLHLVPCLIFSFMFGPVGLALYLIIRWATGRGGWYLEES